MKKRIIAGVTGIRSEYDIMSSVFRKIEEHPRLHLKVIVTGAHLSESYGHTIDAIRDDGFEIADTIESLFNGDTNASRLKGLAVQLTGLIQSVTRINPDLLLVLGDREEAMTTALAGSYLNIPAAHIGGGDRVVGNVDDQIRHAVTKLAHLHFATNPESYRRILNLGEQPFRVFNVGNPGLDRLLTTPDLSCRELSDRLGFAINEGEPLILLIQHIISTETANAYEQMKATLEAVAALKVKTIISYPNSDAGSHQIITALHEYQHLPFVHMQKNIPRVVFVNIMRRAGCMLGNSSAGILEAPLLKLPVVNVGNRQQGRLHAENVQFVAHDVSAIISAVKKALFDTDYRKMVAHCSNPYGDGASSQKIVDILARIPLDARLLIKDITY